MSVLVYFTCVNDFDMRRQFQFFFQAEDGIRALVRSRGLGDVYKRQLLPQTDLYQSLDPSEKLEFFPELFPEYMLTGHEVLSLIHI